MVYVLSRSGTPLMPCSPRKARILLRLEKATVVNLKPFTIQLSRGSSGYKQAVTLGLDSGFNYIGYSAVSPSAELIGGEFNLLTGVSERITERARYRRVRRNQLRYRKPASFKDTKSKGWIAPSIRHKVESHLRLVTVIKGILPITDVIVEVGNFDIQKIKNPSIDGVDYQNGPQKDFDDLREYILHRDGHTCQNPSCTHKSSILQVHHLGYWKKDRSDRPENLITLCLLCHTPENHQKSGFLFGWKPALKGFREATFMSIVRWRIVNALNCKHTYGSATKRKRRELEMEKSHHNDAFVIADGKYQSRITPLTITQKRRNNRSLEKFYDAKYSDLRDKKPKSGSELCCLRRSRSRENTGQSLRIYRGHKITSGRRSIRKARYDLQPKDIVVYKGQKYSTVGVHNKGSRVIITNGEKPTSKSVKDVKIYFRQKSFVWG